MMTWLKSSDESPVWLVCPHCGEPVAASEHTPGEACEKCGAVNEDE